MIDYIPDGPELYDLYCAEQERNREPAEDPFIDSKIEELRYNSKKGNNDEQD